MSDNLTARQRKAAILVGDDELTNEEIAADCGVDPRTLNRWKNDPEFAAAVKEHIERLARELSRYRIARKDKRVAAYQDRWERLSRVIEIRADNANPNDSHGRQTGTVVREETESGPRYAVDTGVLSAMLQLEKQAAQEAGQWSEKRELTGKDGGPIEVQSTWEVLVRELHDADTPDQGAAAGGDPALPD